MARKSFAEQLQEKIENLSNPAIFDMAVKASVLTRRVSLAARLETVDEEITLSLKKQERTSALSPVVDEEAPAPKAPKAPTVQSSGVSA
jgi:hypothetical protein